MKKIYLSIALIAATLLGEAQQCQNLHDFTGIDGGYPEYGSLISDGTYLYGMTYFGGANARGRIFKIKPDGTGYTGIFDFNSTNGGSPQGSLISDGTYLYGMTQAGGANSKGVIFKIKFDGTGYIDMFDFNGTTGEQPYGSLVSDGTYLYGMTYSGGANNKGVIFKINPDGTSYTDLFDFNGTNGKFPYGSLITDGTYLYGMTNQKTGSATGGVVFKVKTDGTGFTTLSTSVGLPYGSLISDGTYLYGLSSAGGSGGNGNIFKVKTDGTGYTDMLSFSQTGGSGYAPNGSLISDGTYLYGMTYAGGANTGGLIFKIKPDGTGYADLFDFNSASGWTPKGTLYSDGTDLYGMAYNGGANSYGTIFKFCMTACNVGIEQYNNSNSFKIYPNPTTAILTVEWINPNENANIIIYDVIGNEVLQTKQNAIDIRNLENGIYFIKVGSATQKFIKQ